MVRSGAGADAGTDRRTALLAVASVAVLAWSVYGRALDAPFVFDDIESVVENPSIRSLTPLVGPDSAPGPLGRLPTSPVAGRPLVNLTFALNHAVGGLDPALYRAANIVLHVLAGALLFVLARRTLRLRPLEAPFAAASGPLALAATLLWSAHPLVTEAVVYVTQRTELLVSVAWLGTLYAGLRAVQAQTPAARRGWTAVAAVACAAGMASKEVMVAAPVAMLIFHRTFLAGSFRQALRDAAPLYGALASGWVVLVVANWSVPRGDSAGFHVGIGPLDWWVTQAKALLLYLRLAAWPHPLAVHYGFPVVDAASAWPWALPAVAITAGTIGLVRRGRAVGVTAALALLVLAPTLLVPIKTEVVAERRMYLPLAFLVVAAVAGVYRAGIWVTARQGAVRAGRVARGAAAGAVAALLFVECAVAARRLLAYADEVTLWRDTLRSQPNDALAHYNLGVALGDRGAMDEAIRHFDTALRLQPDYPSAHFNVAVALGEMRRPHDAIPHFEEALKSNPTDASAYVIFGITLVQAGRFADAAAQFTRATALAPDDLAIYPLLADAHARAGRRAEAIGAAAEAARRARARGDTATAARADAWIARYRTVSPP